MQNATTYCVAIASSAAATSSIAAVADSSFYFSSLFVNSCNASSCPLPLFFLGSVDDPALSFLEVLKDLRNLRISAFLVTELGVFPSSFGASGLSVKGANIWTISVCPLHAAL